MAFQIEGMKRTFKISKGKETIELPDPNPNMPPEEVIKFYSGEHPELTNATLTGPKVVGSSAEYVAKTNVGTKG